MNRRNFLATVGSIGAMATAGCIGIGSTTITNPEKEQTDDGDVNLNFRTENGKNVATLTVMPDSQRYSGHRGPEVPVTIVITHGNTTKIESLRFDLRAPPTSSGAGVPAKIAYTTPFAKPHPPIDLYTDPDDGSTILDIPNTEKQGEGNLVFDFMLLGLRDSTTELAINVEIGLTEGGALGQEYTLEGSALVALPGETK